jgi:hypothetical protein
MALGKQLWLPSRAAERVDRDTEQAALHDRNAASVCHHATVIGQDFSRVVQ